jgi:hypothetical protein
MPTKASAGCASDPIHLRDVQDFRELDRDENEKKKTFIIFHDI